MYNPRNFAMLDILAYPERASPEYLIYVQQILARKRHKRMKSRKRR
ncbi:MAG: hypothetical protein K6G20_12410 [Ruminococcus sp.]|nr:hypothetical protein [Ruminococcus sp.]